MNTSLDGRVAFISGAGHGIGRATALAMAQLGATIGVNDLKPEFVAETVGEIERLGGRAIALAQDVSSREGMRDAVLKLAREAGRLDILVNNAAWVRYQPVDEITEDVMDRMLGIGFKSVVWGIQAAAEVMDPERGGSIINVASVAGLKSPMRSIVYSGIKAGVLGITRAAAADLGPKRIRVNAVAPGAVPTEGTAKHRNADLDARRIGRTPLGRLGTVEDIADAICFLAGDASRFINADVFAIDGGASQTTVG
ncbi:SDR family NAD(P)-dependent oxidoreductase [Variovorax sp. OV329]|uniref:SDR family NAD(P)-dependent oxidoreductase n=1 Tax=Variovorax sp. OV329 TaxID=1882825 RepID=UPI0008EAB809|nr:SDR family oxidoreductase [Variovorax sp. OV329]SFM18579.1 3-oxoacyl-[acyl-carrier protein] reductase [Variovorax sp. OV329]